MAAAIRSLRGARAILDAIFKFCLQGTPTGVTLSPR